MQLYRYLERQFVERFFDTGELMLSSFTRCRAIEGARQDTREGRSNFSLFDGQRGIYGVSNSGSRTHFLCTSRLLSESLMKKFSVDDFFIVKRPLHFAYSLAECIQDVLSFEFQDCMYTDTGSEAYSQNSIFLSNPNFENESECIEWAERQRAHLGEIVHQSFGNSALFTKRVSYQEEAECRFVWTLRHPASEQLLVSCPNAIAYCRRR